MNTYALQGNFQFPVRTAKLHVTQRNVLEGCIVLNEHNTVFARSSSLYATGVSLGPPESLTQTTSRSLQLFLQGSLGDRLTDRPTDRATRSVTIGTVEKPHSQNVEIEVF